MWQLIANIENKGKKKEGEFSRSTGRSNPCFPMFEKHWGAFFSRKPFLVVVFTLLIMVSIKNATAQVYPVQLTVSASLPATAELTGFANPLVNDFVQLNILPLDLTLTERPVRLKVGLEGQGINAYSKGVLQGISPLAINGGENIQLTGQSLAPYFEFQNLANISLAAYTAMLPQGHYYLRFEIIDQISNQKISNTATTLLFIHINEPPAWVLPENDHTISLDVPVASSPFESSAGLVQLKTNDVFLAYDFPVTVMEATGGNGTFTGTGYIRISFLGGGQPRIKVTFNNIVINSAYRMVYGRVRTTYDSSWGSVTSLNEIFGGGGEVGNILSGKTDPEVTIESGEIIINNEGNGDGIEVDTARKQITVSTQNENGQQTTENVNGNLRNQGDGIVTIIGSGGNLFVVDTDTGQVDHIGKLTEDETKILASFDPYTIHNDLGIVSFEYHENCPWAFDRPNPNYAKSLLLYQNEYETIDHYEGDSVYRPCQKLVGTGSIGKVTAKLTQGNIDAKDLVFITQEGVTLQPEQQGNTLNFELPAACDGYDYKLYALHKEAGSYQQVGQLKVVSYSKKMPEVVLVPVGMDKKDIDLEATKSELRKIFNPVNIEIDIVVADSSYNDFSWDTNPNGVPDIEGDTWFHEYSGEQQQLIKNYRDRLIKYHDYNENNQTA